MYAYHFSNSVPLRKLAQNRSGLTEKAAELTTQLQLKPFSHDINSDPGYK
jgi:hypothetical protein